MLSTGHRKRGCQPLGKPHKQQYSYQQQPL